MLVCVRGKESLCHSSGGCGHPAVSSTSGLRCLIIILLWNCGALLLLTTVCTAASPATPNNTPPTIHPSTQSLISHYGLRESANACPQTYALGIKEVWEVPEEVR